MIAPAQTLNCKQQILIQWDRVELTALIPPNLTEEEFAKFYEEAKGLSQWFGAVQVNEQVRQVKSGMFLSEDAVAAKKQEMDLFKEIMSAIAEKLNPPQEA